MAKIDTLFMNKTAEKPYPFGPTYLGSTPQELAPHGYCKRTPNASNNKNNNTLYYQNIKKTISYKKDIWNRQLDKSTKNNLKGYRAEWNLIAFYKEVGWWGEGGEGGGQ